MTVIEYLLQFVPELFLSTLAAVTFLVCLYSWLKFKDYPALGYLFPAFYISAIYAWFLLTGPDELARRFFARIGIAVLLIDVIAWRLNLIIREAKKRNGK